MKIWFKTIVITIVIAILLIGFIMFFPLFLFFGLIGFIFLILKFVELVNGIADFEIEEEKDSQR